MHASKKDHIEQRRVGAWGDFTLILHVRALIPGAQVQKVEVQKARVEPAYFTSLKGHDNGDFYAVERLAFSEAQTFRR